MASNKPWANMDACQESLELIGYMDRKLPSSVSY
jgi:hypothetical protein